MTKTLTAILVGLLLFVAFALNLTVPSHAQGVERDLIFHNGVIVPMTAPDVSYSAMRIRGAAIEELGTDAEILALAGENATIIDLEGRAVYPGFIDPHTHLLGNAAMVEMTMAEAERLALSFGITHVADMHVTSDDLRTLRAFATDPGLTIRSSMYLVHNDGCGNLRGRWYEEYPAGSEVEPRLYVGGIKVFSERSVCGPRPIGISFGEEMKAGLSERGRERFEDTEPLFTVAGLADVFERIDALGYQIAVHAIGDGGITTTLDAFEALLDGGENARHHMLLHNWFVSDASLVRYAELGVCASVEVSTPCYIQHWENHVLPEYQHTVFRYADLVGTGAHIAASSDWPWVGSAALEPLFKLQILTTGTSDIEDIFEQGAACFVDASKRVTVWEALRMMTAEAAYLLRVDDVAGTLEPGKRADLVILSADPLRAPLDDLHTIDVESTYIDGELVWESVP